MTEPDSKALVEVRDDHSNVYRVSAGILRHHMFPPAYVDEEERVPTGEIAKVREWVRRVMERLDNPDTPGAA
ncbi:MAG: hypothetical protein ACRDRA_14865 [Pseudonocardiaceae bacterium]